MIRSVQSGLIVLDQFFSKRLNDKDECVRFFSYRLKLLGPSLTTFFIYCDGNWEKTAVRLKQITHKISFKEFWNFVVHCLEWQ